VNMQPYPGIDVWQLDESAITATLAAVQRPGRDGKEGGVFWVGTRAPVSVVHAVVVPAGHGVIEAASFWQVSPEVYGAISRWAADRGWSLLGICHTHGEGVPARLSTQDRRHLVRAPGVLAVVIGSGGRDHDLERWGWYEFTSGAYREISPDERHRRLRLTDEGGIEVWAADRRGCRPAVNL
jgi:Prokaryotic homologs of the JAB domain